MPKQKQFNYKNQSRFICLKCLQIDGTINGIYRLKRRKNGHIKDMWCCHCKETVKALEVKYNNYLPDMMYKAERLHNDYYKGKYGYERIVS